MMPKFTVVIPTYNRAYFLKNAVQSVVNQRYKDWELLIIDDGSTDNTADVAQSFVQYDARVKYIYQKNQERSAARNTGVRHAQGTYICFLDSDDYYLPHHLDALHQATEAQHNPEVFFYTGLLQQIDNQPPQLMPQPPHINPNFVQHFLDFTVYPTVACLHRNILQKYHFDTALSLWEDTALWLRIATEYAVHQVPEHTAVLRVHPQATTYNLERSFTIAQAEAVMNVKKKCLQQRILQPFLTKKAKRKFLSKMYSYYFYDSIVHKKSRYALHFLWKSMYHYPERLCTKVGAMSCLMWLRSIFS
jgi:glycosyltransferase involved in cell wall biosynthesis